MAEHGMAVKPSRPAKSSPAAGQPEPGICLVLALDLSWLLVVMSVCYRCAEPASPRAQSACRFGDADGCVFSMNSCTQIVRLCAGRPVMCGSGAVTHSPGVWQ